MSFGTDNKEQAFVFSAYFFSPAEKEEMGSSKSSDELMGWDDSGTR
jgi:hypothetical protein